MFKCKICNKSYQSKKGLSIHLRKHEISVLNYFIQYENFEIPKCEYCNDDAKFRVGTTYHKTCGNEMCVSESYKDYKASEETKKLLSEKRIKFLKENPQKHPWRSKNKHISEPCEKIKGILTKENISFIEEFQPLNNRFYSIDIAIKDKKVGLEINGNQHYNKDKTLKKYYQKRHDNISGSGWKLYEIHYSKCYDDNFIKELLKLLRGDINDLNLDFEYVKKTKVEVKYYCQCGNEKSKYSKVCIKCSSKNNRKVERPPYKELIKELNKSNYTQVGKKYGVSDNCIRKWIKNYKNENKYKFTKNYSI